MNEYGIYAINHNFDLIFGRLNELTPNLEYIQNFIARQKHTNSNFIWFMLGVTAYIYSNEKRQYRQRKEIANLRKEIDQLKGEQMMR